MSFLLLAKKLKLIYSIILRYVETVPTACLDRNNVKYFAADRRLHYINERSYVFIMLYLSAIQTKNKNGLN